MHNSHYHNQMEVFYLFEGQRRFFIKDNVYDIRSGDLVLIDSNVLHRTSGLAEPTNERIVLYYGPSFFEAFAPEERELLLLPFAGGNPLHTLNLQEKMAVENLLFSLLQELTEQPPGYALHIRNTAVSLLLYISRLIQKRGIPPVQEPSPVHRKVTDIVRHINHHFAGPLQLDDIAKQFYISASHLSRVFRKFTGFGYTEYINITRVREAERLLRDTGWSITLVAERCGFESLTHFGKVFKVHTGLSPRDYRKLHK
nr:AraC family transcriptional regulator [Paenibacillus tepidiphilus]